ncbi:hypothetical protein F5148DRAFT_1280956 [Russula earlei]|uniref:Uncharacterized protein n=1 Tax=Russula earlei TaxID=71964 RepID=A0ACC0UKB2_9AGAM|nr:hypothetical protein F5148DRAFT_1280956 [Russula earlei]
MSPAAIVSVLRQQIAFGTKPWQVGKQPEQRTTLNLHPPPTHREPPTPGFIKPLGGRNTSTGLPLKRPPRIPTSTVADLEKLADDLNVYATTTLEADALPRIYQRQSLRPRLLAILAHTQDVARAWAAYRALLVLPRSPEKSSPKIPFPHRHRLLRLLAAAAPRPMRNRARFAQVLAVLRALHYAGGIIKTWEWNLLLDCVGKEWRRPRQEHFRAALALLAEMRRDASGGGGGDAAGTSMTGGAALMLEPDVFSYTTLLAHAVRTRAPAAVQHATRLLQRAGIAPGVHAHTTLLCFFARRGDLAGVRHMLFRLNQHTQDGAAGLAQVPFNAVLWAFAFNGRLDVAKAMYRVVRARVMEDGWRRRFGDVGEEERGGQEGEQQQELVPRLESALSEREMIFIAREVVPDVVTYHILIQAHGFQGDLRACLETLADMISASAPSPPSSPGRDDDEREQREARAQGEGQRRRQRLTASLPAFRAIFLGFARHGVAGIPAPASSRPSTDGHRTTEGDAPASLAPENDDGVESAWTLATLETLFAQFLELPRDTPLRENTLFWLVSAFVRTSGHDPVVLRRVFERVEGRFVPAALALTCGGANRRGRLARIRERVFSSG